MELIVSSHDYIHMLWCMKITATSKISMGLSFHSYDKMSYYSSSMYCCGNDGLLLGKSENSF